jgi:hypothetical protein
MLGYDCCCFVANYTTVDMVVAVATLTHSSPIESISGFSTDQSHRSGVRSDGMHAVVAWEHRTEHRVYANVARHAPEVHCHHKLVAVGIAYS